MSSTLALTHLGHSCVLIEMPSANDEPIKLLLDPGTLTPQLQPIPDLSAILITHAHPDHVDADQVRRVRGEGHAPIYADEAAAALLDEAGIDGIVHVQPGGYDIGGIDIQVSSWPHEQIYAGVPVPRNTAYFIGGRLFAPGDAFARPGHPIDVLLLPTGAPWMKLAETLDYLRAVAPGSVLPVHDGGLAAPHREMHRSLMEKFAPEGTTVHRPDLGTAVAFD